MPDDANQPVPPVPAQPATPVGASGCPQLSEKEVAEGKAFAILSYAINFIGFPFWLVPLIMRNNDFALYHAKQCLMAWIVLAVGYAAGVALSFVCIGALVIPIVLVFSLIWNIMGIINAAKGECKPLLLIGGFAEKWFEGIRKVPS